MSAFPDACELYAYVQDHLQRIRDNYRSEKGPPVGLYWRLLDASPALVEVTIERVLGYPAGDAAGYGAASLAMKLRKDRGNGIDTARRFLESSADELHGAVARAYYLLDPATFTAEDMKIVRRLLAMPNIQVLQNAVSIVRRFAGKDRLLAIDLLRIVEIGKSPEIAKDVFVLFGHAIPFEGLSRETVQEFLDKLMAIPRLDVHWIETFLEYASQHHADITAQFFMKRVEHAANRKDFSYRPCNHGPFAHVPLRFRESRDFSDIFRRVVNWMRSREQEDDDEFHQHAGQLFETMFGLVDDVILGFVADWIDIAKPAELMSIGAVFSNASERFIFEHRDLVVRLLERAEGFGKDMLRRMISDLYSASIRGMRSGVPGEPFPEDLALKEEADKALKEIPRFSPAYELYDAVRKHAEIAIARCRQEAELFED